MSEHELPACGTVIGQTVVLSSNRPVVVLVLERVGSRDGLGVGESVGLGVGADDDWGGFGNGWVGSQCCPHGNDAGVVLGKHPSIDAVKHVQ
jgi:hypothetical protein